jgi:1,4-dihydroxy-2-naphthoyl-CoA synthase
VGIIWLNRPSALNALNDVLMASVGAAVQEYEQSGAIGAIVLTGEGKAFAAGVSPPHSITRFFIDDFVESRLHTCWPSSVLSMRWALLFLL